MIKSRFNLKELKFKTIFILVIFSALFSFAYNNFSKNSIPLTIERPEIVFENEAGKKISSDKIKAVKFTKAEKLFNLGVVFIDARDKWDFSDGHIKGSVNIPEYDSDSYEKDIKKLDKSDSYIIYCGGDDCDTSVRLYQKLAKMGFEDIYVYLGGWNEWKNSNMPIEKGISK